MSNPGPKPVRTIALMNQKGGVGKTTTTVNLAAAIAKLGRRVLVVDLDPQAHATLHLGVTPGESEISVYDLLLNPEMPAEQAALNVRENLWLIPAETDLAAAETELAGEPDRLMRLAASLRGLASRGFPDSSGAGIDVILLDCPPSLGLLTLNGLCAAREVFIPMQGHFLALQGVSKLLETVALVGRQANPKLHVTGVILCMHDANTTHTREVVADLDDFFEQARAAPVSPDQEAAPWRSARVYRPAVRRNIKLAECPSFGKTIFDYEPSCPGALDYLELARQIVGEWDRLLSRRQGKAASKSDAGFGAAPTTVTTGEPENQRASVLTPIVRTSTASSAEPAS